MTADPAASMNQNTLFAEYLCSGPGFQPSLRATIVGNPNYGRQLTASEAADYTLSKIFAAVSKTDSPFPNGDWIPAISMGLFNIKLIPQGLYDAANNRLQMKDTFTVYLANSTSPYSLVDSAKIIVDSLTFTGQAAFRAASSGTYFLVVKHRNSIETWSRPGGENYLKGATQTFDFSDSQAKAFGNNLALSGGKYCVFGGDVKQDGVVDISDMVQVDNGSFEFASGYLNADVNGDTNVDISDMVIVDNNSYDFVGSVKPVGKPFTKPARKKLTKSSD